MEAMLSDLVVDPNLSKSRSLIFSDKEKEVQRGFPIYLETRRQLNSRVGSGAFLGSMKLMQSRRARGYPSRVLAPLSTFKLGDHWQLT